MIAQTHGVPNGYRQTEVGVIPADWDVRQLSSELLSGPKNGYSGRSNKDARGTPTLMLSATTSGRMILNDQTVKRLGETLDSRSDVFLQPGDVLVQRSNTVELVGKTAIFDGPGDFYAYPDLMMRLRFKAPETANWFWRYANSSNGRSYFVSVAAGSTGSMPKISGDKLRNMPLPIPTLAEQEAIAEALGDADALIESLEQLVAKKRHLKQAAMQQLLTAKKRLPGFEGEWQVQPLGELADIIMGQSPSSSHYNTSGDGLPLIQGNADVANRRTIKRVFTTQVTKRGKTGDILLSVRAPVGEVSRATFNVCLGRGVCAIRRTNDFLYHALIAKEPSWNKLSKGSTFDSVNSADVKAFEVEIPKDESEQTAVSEVLSDMDTEIEAMEAKLTKARQIKQGMMQELLTGRIRLVAPASSTGGKS